jgi:nucleotide-binding universal stress UspA family protein
MLRPRKSLESGHRRKFLVVIDNTPESTRALHYAARRAEHTGGALVLLYVMVPTDFQHWGGVENLMRAEATEEAEKTLAKHADLVRGWSSIEPELVIKEGNRAEQLAKLIEDDEDIGILVLAASSEKDGPGPLVSWVAGKAAGTFPIPITIVPGTLDDEAIKVIA